MNLARKRISKSFTLQIGSSDCGVACLSTVIKFYNGFTPLERIRELSGTAKQGTTVLGLYQAAQQLGFDAQGLEAESVSNLKELDEPAILHVVLHENLQHYYVFFGFDKDDNIVIADPAKGILTITKDELEQVWRSKALLKLIPNKEFVEGKIIKKEKKSWLQSLIEEDFGILIVALFLGTAITILGISTAIFSQKLIDKILPSADYNGLFISLLLLSALLIVKTGLNYLRGFFLISQNKEFNNRVIQKFYSALIDLPKSFFDTRKTGELIARMDDTRRIQNTISSVVGNMLIDGLIIIISLFVIFLYSISIGSLVLFSFLLYFGIIRRFHKRIAISQKDVMQSYALNQSNYIDTIQGIDTIKSNNKEPFFKELTKNAYGFFQQNIYNLGKLNIQYSFWSEVTGVLLILGIFGLSSFQVFQKELMIGEMVAILSLTGSIIPSISRLAIFNIQIQEAKVAFDRMYEIASIKSEHKDDLTKQDIEIIDKIEIKNLNFRFAGRKRLLLNVSLEVKKGELVGILGESGTGKSTLVQILQKFYEPESGLILINNKNLALINTHFWRSNIGVVPQQIKIFNGTLIDNICLGDSRKEAENVISFCKSYGFDTYFSDFPQQYLTILGEEGINISGGQQQLVALARALYKKPKLIILDEATSAMDRNAENFILDLLQQLRNELAIIMITHRIKTASKADKIYLLENGTISNSGTPKELMLTDNYYSLSYKEQVGNMI
ncbi:MAG: peptidase domain-containing ABC transporter [Bacteroidales bacterium]|nr:peptidase domain-containing ABC transporter [Bacteroidales bacterium]